MTFAKLARLSKGLLVREVAAKAGCYRSRYARFENGFKALKPVELHRACSFLGIDAYLAQNEVRIEESGLIILKADKVPTASPRTQSEKGCAEGAPSPV